MYERVIFKAPNINSEWQLFLRDWKQMIWSLKRLHVITLRKFPGCGTGRGIHTGTGWLPEVRTWTVETGDQMQPEFSGKSTRQERAAETENHKSADSCSVLLKYLTSTNQYLCKELLSLGERSALKDWRRKINQSKINPVKQMLELANKGINTFIVALFPMF